MQTTHSNFNFLTEHSPKLSELAHYADLYYTHHDWNTCVMKFRQLGELLVQFVTAKNGIPFDKQTTQADLLRLFRYELNLDKQVIQLFHTLRTVGNAAVHISFDEQTSEKEAQSAFLAAWQLSHWFHRLFGNNSENFKATYKPLAFVAKPVNTQAEQLAEQVQQDIHQVQTQTAQLDSEQIKAVKEKTKQRMRKAAVLVELSEAETRVLIDSQLQEAGWEADSKTLKYSKGVRPEKGRNLAIAEYPTKAGNADYVLFCGLTPLAVVEAKKANVDVAGKITQAERYAKNLAISTACDELSPAWLLEKRTVAWADEQDGHYYVPFVYSCNGRPYLKQLEEKSGTWFRDVREPHHIRRALQQFHTPKGLLDLLKRSREKAESALATEPFDYLHLRDYQVKAIEAVEDALAQNKRTALLAMATGTGKTRTIAGLIYRFLKSERFKRILFLVDRTALGKQAFDTFSEMKMEQNRTLHEIYHIAELEQSKAESETRIQLATVQSMVKRLFDSETPLPIDEFDCIIIDEAHRGYTLDQEMSEGELSTRDAGQYISAYRQVLDYFDAVKIALTATPAKHTTEIFGKPIYTYSYREAVADDWLIDYEPPIRYETELTQKGIHFDKGEKVNVIDMSSGELNFAELEDELNFDVASFNRGVINENFNRVICEQLVQELDPLGDEKTLIFCANDHHADQIKRLLDEAFAQLYGENYNQKAVEKITGKSDKVEQLINHYKNERYPNIAITVDLLSTGIDVPKICNLVFLRRVKSRILFEQMLGRATRRCDEIGKTAFRIYDPVDIYSTLEEVNTMKPLVKDPNVDLAQLVEELSDDEFVRKAKEIATLEGRNQADELLEALTQKIMRTLRRAEKQAENKPALREKLDELQQEWGVSPKLLHQHLHQSGLEKTIAFLQQHRDFMNAIQEVRYLAKSDTVISDHKDKLRERFQDYNGFKRPQDYLESFNQFIQAHRNEQIALMVAVNKPSDLTREQLKDLRQLLDSNGFTETTLNKAFSRQSNQDIAAGIIAHIRRAALGESLVPFSERAEKAMQKLYAKHPDLTPVQKRWLERLKKQLVKEVMLDKQSVNEWFKRDGGAKQLDKLLGESLEQFLAELREAIWNNVA